MDPLRAQYFNPTRLTDAITPKKEFADLAASNCIFYWRGLPNHWHRDVGVAWTGASSHTAWPGDFGDRISMGQKVALNWPSMAARSVSKDQVKKAEPSRSVDTAEVTAPDFAPNTSGLRCELRQIVNAELLLDAGDFVYHAFKTLFAEKLVFLLLEVLA